MPHYPAYTTTVIGAHSVPRWYEALDRLVALGQLAEGDFADAQLRATQAAILEQEIAGIDVITGWRNAPAHGITGTPRQTRCSIISGRRFPPSRERRGQSRSRNMTRTSFIPPQFAEGPIPDDVDLGLVEEFKTVSSFARSQSRSP